MAEAIVSFVIERLGDLILNQANFLTSIADRVDGAKLQLQRIKCLLEDADGRSRRSDSVVRNHVAQAREAAYDLEDVIATFVLKSASRASSHGTGTSTSTSRYLFSCFLSDLHKVGSKIDMISARLSESRLCLIASGVVTRDASSSCRERERQELRRTFSHNIESDFVGFEDNIKELVECLTSQGNIHRVVSICGMGGLGKTTLARQVYYHPRIRHHFDCFAWASISHKCQARDVWEGILLKLVSPTTEKRREFKEMTDGEISKALYHLQKEKRCLVVLDDIWTTLTWDCLESAFPNARSDSKLLFTTRNRDVASHADRNSYLHEPKCFNQTETWELFAKKAQFGIDVTDSEEENKKEELARKMLDYCGGLPLAITVLGGLLSSKQTVDEWECLHKNIKTYMRKGKINEQEDSNLGISWVLGLSYDELPYYLKPCFLHLAFFPEDFEIRAKELCRIWVAEGFASTEDRAYIYLSELVERCIVQVAEWGSTKRIKTFRIHDLMRDLCLSKSQEENFLHTHNINNQHEAMNSSCFEGTTSFMPTNKVRRLSICSNTNGSEEVLSLIGKMDGCLRSLICFSQEQQMLYYQVMKPLLKHFHLLRVLKFENLGRGHVGELPEEIGKLIHLRLFSLRDSYVEKFPGTMGNLRCLETLDLRVKDLNNEKHQRYSEIPPVLWKLEQLRHLYLPQNYNVSRIAKSFFTIGHFESILRLDNLSNLQTVVNVSANYYYLDGLQRLTNLNKLKVNLGSGFKGVTSVFNNLRSLAIYYSGFLEYGDQGEEPQMEHRQRAKFTEHDVRSLILRCPQMCKLHLQVPIMKLPEDSQFSPKLIKLTLVRTCLKDDPMVTLEKLPSLRILVLDYDAFRGHTLVCTQRGFPRLESLSICYVNNLKEWEVEEGALPSLRCLHIVSCLRLRTVPDGLRYVITLKEMVIQHMLRQFKKRVEQGGEDFYKVQHVPSLAFINTLEF